MIDPFTPEALEDPYDLYATLRADAPVRQLDGTELWMVSRYEDLVEAASKPDIFSSHISAVIYAGQGPTPAVLQADPDAIGAVDVLATADPPDHTLQRKLMNRTFVPSRIADREQDVRTFVDERLDDALAAGRSEWMDEVAVPLPVSIMGSFLGMSSDLPDLVRWADAGVDLLSGVATPERMMECWGEMTKFLAYLRSKQEDPEPGSVTADIAAAVKRGDLNEREGVSLLLQLVIAGSESTASLIGSATLMLCEQPALQDELRTEPSRIPTFLEEALRLESPFRGHFRITTEDTTLGGVEIPKGSRVMLMWGSANRDDTAFPSAASLDLDRPHPKSHVGFGTGIHTCIGAPLARMESRVTMELLLERTRGFRLAAGAAPVKHVPSLFVRRVERLDLELDPS